MASEKLKPCPLCGRESHAIQPITGKGQPWNIGCGTGRTEHDPADEYGCGLVLFGSSNVARLKMVSRWNKRS